MRTAQADKALAIENKRRQTKGQPLLDSLLVEDPSAVTEETSDETQGPDANVATGEPAADQPAAQAGEKDSEDEPDVLLLETGRILADLMALTQVSVATRSESR